MRLTEKQLKARQKGTTKEPKKPKYNNKKVEYDGIKFDSQKEFDRYKVLWTWQKNGLISDLKLQPVFIIANSVRIKGKKRPARVYKADFSYIDEDGNFIVEDVKSKITAKNPVYTLKRHLMMERHGIEIKEVL